MMIPPPWKLTVTPGNTGPDRPMPPGTYLCIPDTPATADIFERAWTARTEKQKTVALLELMGLLGQDPTQ